MTAEEYLRARGWVIIGEHCWTLTSDPMPITVDEATAIQVTRDDECAAFVAEHKASND